MKQIYSANITPMDANGNLDAPSFERLLNRNISHGVSGFFLFGTMGEGFEIAIEEKSEIIQTATQIIDGRAETLVGISSLGLSQTLGQIEKLSPLKFDAYAMTLPFGYDLFPDPVALIHQVADRSDRPLYFYHRPVLPTRDLTPAQFRDLLQHPKVLGIKNSSGKCSTRKELLMLKRDVDFKLLEGDEWAVDEALMIGCDGALVGFCSLASKLFVELARSVDDGDYAKAKEIQFNLIDIFHGVYGVDFQNVFTGQKYALQKLGHIDSADVRLHTGSMSLDDRKRIDDAIEKYRHLLD